jgi:hypothetical protein
MKRDKATAMVHVRLDAGLRERLEAETRINRRSLSGEIEHRLRQSFEHAEQVGGLQETIRAMRIKQAGLVKALTTMMGRLSELPKGQIPDVLADVVKDLTDVGEEI